MLTPMQIDDLKDQTLAELTARKAEAAAKVLAAKTALEQAKADYRAAQHEEHLVQTAEAYREAGYWEGERAQLIGEYGGKTNPQGVLAGYDADFLFRLQVYVVNKNGVASTVKTGVRGGFRNVRRLT